MPTEKAKLVFEYWDTDFEDFSPGFFCMASGGEAQLACTRHIGHRGRHVAHFHHSLNGIGRLVILAHWNDDGDYVDVDYES